MPADPAAIASAGSAPVARLAPAELDLIHRFVHDMPGGFEAVVAAHGARVTRLAHRLLGWAKPIDVEDVVQDVFLSAFRHRTRFAARASLGTWLTSITINRCRTHERQRGVRQLLFRRRGGELLGEWHREQES